MGTPGALKQIDYKLSEIAVDKISFLISLDSRVSLYTICLI
jgi:hypothetical protein